MRPTLFPLDSAHSAGAPRVARAAARTMLRLGRVVALACLLSPAAATAGLDAQQPPAQSSAPPRFEEHVIVTPTRADSTIARVPAFVTLFDTDDIARAAVDTIPDLLRQAGVQVTDLTGNGRSYRVDLRGFGAAAGANTVVLVDGRRVNQPDQSGSDWAQIPLAHVERIEVIRGGAAVSYGDNAAGGVINIITKSGLVPGTRAGLRTGSFATVTPEGSSHGTRGALSYSLSGRYHRSDGHRTNAQTAGGNVAGRLGIRPGGVFELDVSGGYHGDRTGLPGALTETALDSGTERTDSATPNDRADVDDVYVMATPRVSLGDRGYTLVDVSVRQRDSIAFSSFAGGEFSGDTGTRTVTASPKLVVAAAAGRLAQQIVAGADVSTARADIGNTLVLFGVSDVGLFTLEKSGRALYVRDEVTAGVATVSGGYRYDVATFTFAPSTPSGRSFRAHAGDLGATVLVARRTSAYGRVSRSFRYPLLDELFDFFSNTILDTLELQRSIEVEGGLRVASESARAGISVFRLTTEDEIFFNPAGGAFGFGANENLDGTGHRTGVEMTAAARLGAASLGGTLTMIGTSIAGGRYDGRPMPGVARTTAAVQARLPLVRHLSLGVDATYTGARHFEGDFDSQFGEQDAYVLLDARVRYQPGRARFFVDLKNLLNRQYSEFGVIGGFPAQRAYYPSPGFHAFAGIDLGF